MKSWLKNMQVHKRHIWPGRELEQALGPLARRVTWRYWLDSARLALLWGLAASGALLALLRLYPAFPPPVALFAGGAIMLGVILTRLYRRPDVLAVVRVADELGLNGEAVTAFRLLETGAGDAWSREALTKGTNACARFAPGAGARYPAVPRWRPWRDLALLAVVLLVLQAVPDHLGSYWAERKEEQRALQAAAREARLAVDQIKNLQVNGEDILPGELQKKLGDLPREVARAGDRNEAAAELERARWEVDGARAVIDPSAGRDMQRLAEAWGSVDDGKWQDMARALSGGDEGDIQKAARELVEKTRQGGEEANLELAAALLAGAGMVEDPALRKSLRDTAGAALTSGNSAGQSGSGSGAGQDGDSLSAAVDSLAGALAGAAGTASAGGALGSASAALASAAQSLGGTGSAGAGSQVAGNASGTGGNGGGTGGTAPGGANASGAGEPGGTGSGSDGDNGSGAGGDNSGDGAGGSGPGSGGQGSGAGGASSSGGGMDMIYTPFHPDGGVDSQVRGQVGEGQQGSETALERSPVALGELRPYTEVYGRYMAEAQESLGRAPLPPDMEKLVWQYFNSLNN